MIPLAVLLASHRVNIVRVLVGDKETAALTEVEELTFRAELDTLLDFVGQLCATNRCKGILDTHVSDVPQHCIGMHEELIAARENLALRTDCQKLLLTMKARNRTSLTSSDQLIKRRNAPDSFDRVIHPYIVEFDEKVGEVAIFLDGKIGSFGAIAFGDKPRHRDALDSEISQEPIHLGRRTYIHLSDDCVRVDEDPFALEQLDPTNCLVKVALLAKAVVLSGRIVETSPHFAEVLLDEWNMPIIKEDEVGLQDVIEGLWLKVFLYLHGKPPEAMIQDQRLPTRPIQVNNLLPITKSCDFPHGPFDRCESHVNLSHVRFRVTISTVQVAPIRTTNREIHTLPFHVKFQLSYESSCMAILPETGLKVQGLRQKIKALNGISVEGLKI